MTKSVLSYYGMESKWFNICSDIYLIQRTTQSVHKTRAQFYYIISIYDYIFYLRESTEYISINSKSGFLCTQQAAILSYFYFL